jgi:hypothetical protein
MSNLYCCVSARLFYEIVFFLSLFSADKTTTSNFDPPRDRGAAEDDSVADIDNQHPGLETSNTLEEVYIL